MDHVLVLLGAGEKKLDASWKEEQPWVSPDAFAALAGWELKPEGLCRDDRCVPLPARRADAEGRMPATLLAALVGCPLAVHAPDGVAYLGEASATRAEALASLEAPNFALPDLAGRMHSLSEQRGKKVVLVALASW